MKMTTIACLFATIFPLTPAFAAVCPVPGTLEQRSFLVFLSIDGKMEEGAGIMLDNGYMLTNRHVAEKAELMVALNALTPEKAPGARFMQLKPVKVSETADLALLKVVSNKDPSLADAPEVNLPPLHVAQATSRKGDMLYAYTNTRKMTDAYETKSEGYPQMFKGPSTNGDSGVGMLNCAGELTAVIFGGRELTYEGATIHITGAVPASEIRPFLTANWPNMPK